MPESQAYAFGSTEGVAAVIAAIPAGPPWRLLFTQKEIDALRVALTEAAANTCLSGCTDCPQSCWRANAGLLAGELPVLPQKMWSWFLEPGSACAVLKALVAAWDHECSPQHPSGCPDDCWRFIAGDLAGAIAEAAGVQWI